jgi:adenylate cyclase class 2
MRFEVEQKHRVAIDDGWPLAIRLAAHGGTLGPPVDQSDRYFNHPSREFAKTDEALRIRTIGDESFITYKGPKLDRVTKTRRELELPLHPNDPHGGHAVELLQALGFVPVIVVEKTRRPFTIVHLGREVDGAYDIVDQLGVFVELELVVDEGELDEAKRIIASLAEELELGPSVRESYLELLLSRCK